MSGGNSIDQLHQENQIDVSGHLIEQIPGILFLI